jgi:hypothetical protein
MVVMVLIQLILFLKLTMVDFLLQVYQTLIFLVIKLKTQEGESDYWVIKINSVGNIEWQKTIGGNQSDYITSAILTSDGGYLVGGNSVSNISGDKTENSIGPLDDYDYWVIKMNSSGDIQWQETIGGITDDLLNDMIESTSGGYLLGGYSDSDISGDKTEDSIENGVDSRDDYWVVKIDNSGNVEWDNTIGGTDADRLYAISETSDLGYILFGNSKSNISGDKTENNKGSDDYWVVKLNSNGIVEWDKTIGGNQSDFLRSALVTNDNGFLLGGVSYSDASGDKTENNKGEGDYWVVKLNSLGNIEWENTIGGDWVEVLTSATKTSDNGYLISGNSGSNISFDKTENSKGSSDFWIVKVNSLGQVEWDKTIGVSNSDIPRNITLNNDDSYFLSGNSSSDISGDKTENSYGGTDIWIVKLESETLGISNQIKPNKILMYPNPVKDVIELDSTEKITSVNIYSILGAFVKEIKVKNNSLVDVSNLSSGIYLIEINSGDKKITKKFIKE